jgi:hypothetical protein
VFCSVADCGDTPLLDTFGEGVLWETRDTEGAGEVLEDLEGGGTNTSGLGEAKGGLSPIQDSGERSIVGRGEMGIFQMTASSGSSSSSSSSHSASLSLRVFLFESCHDCLLEPSAGEGKTSFRELLRDRVRGAVEDLCVLDGDGEREERAGAARLRLEREGTEGEVKPRLACCLPGADSWACWRTAWLTGPLRLGYFCLVAPVRSRNECAECEWARDLVESEARGASKRMRLDGLEGMGKDGGPPDASSRLMSSKWERFSVVPIKSSSVDEWMLDDLDDFEFVRSGGLPGAWPNVCWASWA